MKRFSFLFIFLMCVAANLTTANAQDDDVYFVPSKSSKQADRKAAMPESSYSPISSDSYYEESNWAEGRGNGNRDIDEYNRRFSHADTMAVDSGQYSDNIDGEYTQRLIRFHSPSIGIYVSSPYYWDFCDYYWNDPWIYSRWYWGGWGFGSYYWNTWWGWPSPWYYDYAWGWYPHWGWHQPIHVLPSNARRGPVGGYVTYGNRGIMNGNRSFGRHSRDYASRSGLSGYRPSRNMGGSRGFSSGNYRPSRSSNSFNRPRRSFTPQRNSNSFRPSQNSMPSRSSFESPSRSSFGSPSRSGIGGGRSFGGGGGRSFGGRR